VPDHLSLGLVPDRGLRVVFARVGDTARASRALHGLQPTSAYLFAQALAAAALFGATQRPGGRANLQVVCDGPVRGLVVDAEPTGALRGYVRVPSVHFAGEPAQAARAALGGTGHLAVRLDPGDGTHQRSLLDLRERSLPEDLRRWFASSQVVAAAADVAVVPHGDEPLGDVAAILVTQLGDDATAGEPLRAARARVAEGALARSLAAGATAGEIVAAVAGAGLELQADVEVAYRCGCSQLRARVAVSALGPEGIADILRTEGKATITCEFCRSRYVLQAAELEEIARRITGTPPA
jgi:molecular chaperone Hsp33